MPIFALGEAQNLLLILEEYWSQHPDLQTIPIYYTSNLARKCMAVYQAYTNMMNDRIRTANKPFDFKYIQFLKQVDQFEDVGPCVMLATPGMLQSGGSRILLEKWCSDARNGLILAGYSVEGTMARVLFLLSRLMKHLVTEPNEIVALTGQKIPRRMSVEEIMFAAHVDYTHNSQFIEAVNANHIVISPFPEGS
jgi:cleavage and polyadenylation specificity factor subunit 3